MSLDDIKKNVLTERSRVSQLLAVAMDELLSTTSFEQLDENQAVPQVRILDAKSGAEVRRFFTAVCRLCFCKSPSSFSEASVDLVLRGGARQIFSIDFPGTPRVLAISLDGLLAVEGEISPLYADTPRAYVAIHVFAVASGALVWARR
jgi:hypothetical protein